VSSAFDYKKEYKDLYMPKSAPMTITVPLMNFIKVDGKGDPNSGEFQAAVSLLYGVAFTIKMSKMGKEQPEGYFDYVVPPLEGLWWIEGENFSLEDRDIWCWTLMLRQPEFVDEKAFEWARQSLAKKHPEYKIELIRFESFDEGLCVQVMHKGSYAAEPETMAKISAFITENNLIDAVSDGGKHHEIYLSDPRRGKPENMRTVLRHPVLQHPVLRHPVLQHP
jgi:hypothetical protein